MSELTPITRVESYLDAIINSGIPPTEDITRIETFLQAIYDNQVCALTPITRIEMFLGKISGQDIVLPEPITRVELYLAAIAGEDVELPENPITRIEMYLADWADSGDWTTISGAIVEFITQRAHKLKSCVVTLEPVQDLHGYDSPWPAGGGKQLYSVLIGDDTLNNNASATHTSSGGVLTISATSANGSGVYATSTSVIRQLLVSLSGTYTVSFDIKANKTASILCGPEAYATAKTVGTSWQRISFTSTYSQQATTFICYNRSGEDVTIDLKNVMVAAGSESTYSPYSNLCPISGWTGCEVMRTGDNLLDPTKQTEDLSTRKRWYWSDGFLLKANTQYTFTEFHEGSGAVTIYFMPMGSVVGLASGTHSATYTPSEDTLVRFQAERSGGIPDGTVFQLSVGSAASNYEAYQGNSYSVTWEDEAGTVYGGTLDAVSGVLTATHILYDIDGTNRYFSASGSYWNVYPFNELPLIDNSSRLADWKCSISDGAKWNYNSGASFIYTMSTNWTGVFADVNEINAFASTNTIQLLLKLATPTTASITPTPITALKGYNAMWSDGGDIEVTVHGTPVEVETLQALNMLLGGAYRNDQTADDVPDKEALDIILGGENR